ncbi:MAG: hypothetical protein JW942_01670 [Opitutales bacterium]|nr:hypothetical protein [Opitutales bacterium]
MIIGGNEKYSVLRVLRECEGVEAFEARIADYREKSNDSPTIRVSKRSYETLYLKSSVLLTDLEKYLGSDKFFAWLKAVHAAKIDNTDALLSLLEESHGKEARDWLDKELGTL